MIGLRTTKMVLLPFVDFVENFKSTFVDRKIHPSYLFACRTRPRGAQKAFLILLPVRVKLGLSRARDDYARKMIPITLGFVHK